MSAPSARLPLTVIGGFLGAGKTTLLQHWLRTAGGRRLAVLVNDFGALNVDAALIAASGADTIALSNGCVCCQIGDDLSAALMRVLDSADRFDAIVVEASGVSDPWRIAQIGLADPALALGGVIVLADASALPAQAADPLLADTLQRQLDSADLIVLNKSDLVDAAELQRVGEWLDAHAGAVPRLQTQQAAVPPLLLDELRWPHAATPAGGCAPDAHAHGHTREHDNSHPEADAQGQAQDHSQGHSQGRPHGRPQGHSHEHSHGHAHDDVHHPVTAGGHEPGHGRAHDPGDPAHGALFDTWSAQPGGVYSLTALRLALRALPRGVLRLKGWLRTDEHGWSELQFAGRHSALRRALAAPPGGAALVAIGLRGRLSAPALDDWLAAAGTVGQPPGRP